MRYTVTMISYEVTGNQIIDIGNFDDYSIAFWFGSNYIETQPTGTKVEIISNEFGNILYEFKKNLL